jgi:hypothetical protein
MILKANTDIIHGSRCIPKGAELVVGKDVTEEEAQHLLSMGHEVTAIEEAIVDEAAIDEAIVDKAAIDEAIVDHINGCSVTPREIYLTPRDHDWVRISRDK